MSTFITNTMRASVCLLSLTLLAACSESREAPVVETDTTPAYRISGLAKGLIRNSNDPDAKPGDAAYNGQTVTLTLSIPAFKDDPTPTVFAPLLIGAGDFRLPYSIDDSSLYTLSIGNIPNGMKCGLLRGEGTISGEDIENVLLDCAADTETLISEVATISNSNSVSDQFSACINRSASTGASAEQTIFVSKLKVLSCTSMRIVDISQVNQLTALEGVELDWNPIGNPEALSTLPNLKYINLSNIGLSSFDTANFSNLEVLKLANNRIDTGPDLSANTKLLDLDLGGNSFPNINLDLNTELVSLNLSNNSNLSGIDVAMNTKLENLYLADSNNAAFTSIDLSNNTGIRLIDMRNMDTDTNDAANPKFVDIADFDLSNNRTIFRLRLSGTSVSQAIKDEFQRLFINANYN